MRCFSGDEAERDWSRRWDERQGGQIYLLVVSVGGFLGERGSSFLLVRFELVSQCMTCEDRVLGEKGRSVVRLVMGLAGCTEIRLTIVFGDTRTLRHQQQRS
ncbi:hypothetical protein MPTK1_7g10070 [Marchantia polymorpha subsp. ruderalis]|uniref:Uncharacterized protein n=2 Tax=Marchantia polymorpha TaxID=3197 RepID=A0AAF6BXZ7_MARPO|nr:hypothetical protein MARPO_0003s0026 [Marchantia polymorpha]BBN16881.1 hypothetical protein Mp_7g10070 [Marchantia polymorpha subsp. ruderalis]|eukprot:PTQ49121.1 hypothetical protein MARPO_0003s0026 [Marchantia polymorpha]